MRPYKHPTQDAPENQKMGRTMKAFQTAIAENPTDATTRLVYSDWLEEHNCPYEASYQRWVGFTIQRGDWPPVAVLTSVPFLHLSDLVKLKLNKLPPAIANLFLRDWQSRQLLAPWEVEKMICKAFIHKRFIFSAEPAKIT